MWIYGLGFDKILIRLGLLFMDWRDIHLSFAGIWLG